MGGLLLTETPAGGTHFHYDGNGNVTPLTGSAGTVTASYRYDAFGNALVATGPAAAENNYRFGTKPLDGEIAAAPLYYYGYRYYIASLGRWPSRDPIEEDGGINLYEFVGNDALNSIDALGEKIWKCIRKVDGFPYCGNHSYLWNDKTKTPCGMSGSSGRGQAGNPDLV